jgi:hypothetical protein
VDDQKLAQYIASLKNSPPPSPEEQEEQQSMADAMAKARNALRGNQTP